jgi:glutamate/tyrosine decarboxylase-like PLP-dependent enzyme
MAKLAMRQHIWLHVDAAMAGSGMICPEQRHLGWASKRRFVGFEPAQVAASRSTAAHYVRDVQHPSA